MFTTRELTLLVQELMQTYQFHKINEVTTETEQLQ